MANSVEPGQTTLFAQICPTENLGSCRVAACLPAQQVAFLYV